jgi:phospholipid/cholesterol/gamma-HCH transport system substrate-binding protein
METRASPFIVGLFTIAVLVGVALTVFWIGRYSEATGREQYRIVFNDDVTGLNRGSSVLFNGIRVGEVLRLSIGEDPSEVVALIAIDGSVPIRADTRAQLQFQGVTGVGFVQLMAGRDPRPLREAWTGPEGEPPIIHAERSTFQDLMEGAQTLMARLDSVAGRVDTLLSENEAAVTNTLNNVETFTAALADNADSVASFLSEAGAAATRIAELGGRLEARVGASGEQRGHRLRLAHHRQCRILYRDACRTQRRPRPLLRGCRLGGERTAPGRRTDRRGGRAGRRAGGG